MLLIFIALAQTLLNGYLGVVQGQTYLGDVYEPEYLGDDEPEYPDDIDETGDPDDEDETESPGDIDEETEYIGDVDEPEYPDDIDETGDPVDNDETESPGDIDKETEYDGDIHRDKCEISSDPKQIRPSQCCNVGDILPSDFKTFFNECEKSHSVTYEIPDGYRYDPWTLWVHHTACLDECIFRSLGLLTEYGNIDKTNMRASFTYGIKEPVLAALHIGLDNCFVIWQKEIEDIYANRDLVCESRATDLLGCYMREVFINCPNDLWMNDDDLLWMNDDDLRNQCDTLWNKVDRCPKIHVMLHEPTLPQIKTKSSKSNQKKTKPKRF